MAAMTVVLIIIGVWLAVSVTGGIYFGYRWHAGQRTSIFEPENESAEIIPFPKRDRRAA